jgi:hypothetical protein
VWVFHKYFGLQHSFQLINLECDAGIYDLASVCSAKKEDHQISVPIEFPPVKTETEVS